jgi:hypothetical protein
MTARTNTIRCAVLFACLGLYGCSSGKEPYKRATRPTHDAAVDFDAAAEAGADAAADASSLGPDDADSDGAHDGSVGPQGDAEPAADGGGSDSGKPGDPASCTVPSEDNSYATTVAFNDDSRFSMAIGTTGFGVAYAGPDCTIRAMPVQASGAFPSPAKALEDCATTIRELSLLHVADGWRVVWIDNSAGSAELQTMVLRDDMSERVGDLRTQLTTNTLREQRHALAKVGDSALLAFIAMDPVTSKQRISTLLLDGASSAQDVIAESAGHKPLNLALLQMGENDVALAWVEEQGAPGVWLQRTDLKGASKGAPIKVSDVLSAGSTVDLAARDVGQGGALLYSLGVGGINQEVRFRRLDQTGALLGDESKVVGAPLQGRDASFARLGGGYVVAYRALPGGPITSPEIRITFISKEGTLQHDASGSLLSYKLGEASSGGGRLTVRVSNDGQVLVGFVDTTSTGDKQVRLIRKRLDCTL